MTWWVIIKDNVLSKGSNFDDIVALLDCLPNCYVYVKIVQICFCLILHGFKSSMGAYTRPTWYFKNYMGVFMQLHL